MAALDSVCFAPYVGCSYSENYQADQTQVDGSPTCWVSAEACRTLQKQGSHRETGGGTLLAFWGLVLENLSQTLAPWDCS